MRKYDPDKAPNPREWLALDEQERMNLVKRYHRREGDYGESLELHTAFHTVVETQLAEKPRETQLRAPAENSGHVEFGSLDP
jgi:hypothetical protein